MKTKEDYLKSLSEDKLSNLDFSNSEYHGYMKVIKFVCSVHGVMKDTGKYVYESSCGCRLCSQELKESSRIIRNRDKFLELARYIHKGYYDYSKVDFKKVNNKVTIICPLHGDFEQTPVSHRTGSGCGVCSKIRAGKSLEIPPQEIVRRLENRFGDRFTCDTETYSKGSLDITCKVHGTKTYDFNSFLKTTEGCSLCYSDKEIVANNRTSVEDNIRLLEQLYEDRYEFVYSDICRSTDKVRYYCKEHDFHHSTQLKHLKDGHACPKCGSDKGSLKLSGFYNETVIERKKEFFKSDPNNIYLLHLEQDKYKVGLAKDISTRISSIKWGSHLKPTKLLLIKGNTYDLFYKEQSILSNYKSCQYIYPKNLSFKGYTEVLQLNKSQLDELYKRLKEN